MKANKPNFTTRFRMAINVLFPPKEPNLYSERLVDLATKKTPVRLRPELAEKLVQLTEPLEMTDGEVTIDTINFDIISPKCEKRIIALIKEDLARKQTIVR